MVTKYKTEEERKLARRQQWQNYQKNNRVKCRLAGLAWYYKNRERSKATATKSRKRRAAKDPLFYAVQHAKSRAKRFKIPFNIKSSDLVLPEFCPVLGVKLLVGKEKACFKDNTPTIDRLIPSLGYVIGNVDIISMRANRIKNDASLEELEKVTSWVANRSKQSKLSAGAS